MGLLCSLSFRPIPNSRSVCLFTCQCNLRILLTAMEMKNSTLIPFLEKQPHEQILGARCPTKGEVFRPFFFLRYIRKVSVNEALQAAVDAARQFWTAAGITPKLDRYAKDDQQNL